MSITRAMIGYGQKWTGKKGVLAPRGRRFTFGPEGMPAAMTVELDDLDLFRRGHSGTRSRLLDLGLAHNGSEMPWARMNRKCTYINNTIRAGSTNTWRVKKRCRVGGPTTGPPCSSSLTNMPSC